MSCDHAMPVDYDLEGKSQRSINVFEPSGLISR